MAKVHGPKVVTSVHINVYLMHMVTGIYNYVIVAGGGIILKGCSIKS